MPIDWWTLAFQTVNVLVLIWILGRFFFRPVADMVAKRQEAAKRLLADADKARAEAEAALADAARALADTDADRERRVAEARKTAEAAGQERLAEASQEIAKRRREAEAAIAHDRAAAEAAVISRASALSVDIAGRLLARLPARATQMAFVDELCQALKDRAPAGEPESALEIVTAADLTAAQTGRVREAAKSAFGPQATCRFRTDPGLIAGIELRGRHLVMRNSWRADLERIREELEGERTADGS